MSRVTVVSVAIPSTTDSLKTMVLKGNLLPIYSFTMELLCQAIPTHFAELTYSQTRNSLSLIHGYLITSPTIAKIRCASLRSENALSSNCSLHYF